MLRNLPIEIVYEILKELPLVSLIKLVQLNRWTQAVATGAKSPVRHRFRDRRKMSLVIETSRTADSWLTRAHIIRRRSHQLKYLHIYMLRIIKEHVSNEKEGLSSLLPPDFEAAQEVLVRCCPTDELHKDGGIVHPPTGVFPMRSVLHQFDEAYNPEVNLPQAFFDTKLDAYTYIRNFVKEISKFAIINSIDLNSYAKNRFDWLVETIDELDIASTARIDMHFNSVKDYEAMIFQSADRNQVVTNFIPEHNNAASSLTYRPLNKLISKFKNICCEIDDHAFDKQSTMCYTNVITSVYAEDLSIGKWKFVVFARRRFSAFGVTEGANRTEACLRLLLSEIPLEDVQISNFEMTEMVDEYKLALRRTARVRTPSKYLSVDLAVCRYNSLTLKFYICLKTQLI